MADKFEKSENRPQLPTPEQIQEEQLWLLDEQARQAAIMDEHGITSIARAKLSEHDAAQLNDLSRSSICLSTRPEEGGEVTEIIKARFATAKPSKSGVRSTGFVYAPLVKVSGDSMSFDHDLTLKQAEVLIGITQGLKIAKDLGVARYLAGDLANINNPLTYMMASPPK